MFHIKTPPKSPARLVWKFIVSYFLKFLSHQLILFPTIPFSTGHNSAASIYGQDNPNVVTVSCEKRLGLYPLVIEVTNYWVTKTQLKLVKTVKHSIIFPVISSAQTIGPLTTYFNKFNKYCLLLSSKNMPAVNVLSLRK